MLTTTFAVVVMLGACRQALENSHVQVGRSIAKLDEMARTTSTPKGDVPLEDLDRMSSNSRVTWAGPNMTVFLHNHLDQGVEDILLRLVIFSESGEVVIDKVYDHSWCPANSDLAFKLRVSRLPEPGETLAWGLLGAKKR